jgi:phosphoribosylglycinamide formyltransferase 1
MSLRLGILLSGRGRTLANLLDCIEARRLDARIECVVSSSERAHGLTVAREHGVATYTVSRRHNPDFHGSIARTLREHDVDLACMAGLTCLWRIPNDFDGRVINIHPALLPSFGGRGFYGLKVHEAVLASGVRRSGCTVHHCNNEYDQGPIIMQREVPILEGDTPTSLADRVFEQECVLYPQAIKNWAAEFAVNRAAPARKRSK